MHKIGIRIGQVNVRITIAILVLGLLASCSQNPGSTPSNNETAGGGDSPAREDFQQTPPSENDTDSGDKDRDGILDEFDICPINPDASQLDTDQDGAGDACDNDDDNDGIIDFLDNCITASNASQSDDDGDGVGDACDASEGDTAEDSPVLFEARVIDGPAEDTAGPKVVHIADMDGDGLLDVVSAWDDSQPIQISMQSAVGGDVSFETFSIVGSGPFAKVTQLGVADFDQDGSMDIAATVANTGFTPDPFIDDGATRGGLYVLFSPGDPRDNLEWHYLTNDLSAHYECDLLDGAAVTNYTFLGRDGEDPVFVDLDIGDVDNDGDADIAMLYNGVNTDTDPQKELHVRVNPGGAAARQQESLIGAVAVDLDGDGSADACSLQVDEPWETRIIDENVNVPHSVRFADFDDDGNLDVMSTAPLSTTWNMAWYQNLGSGFGSGRDPHPLGENNAGWNEVEIVDMDGEGRPDVLVSSANGKSVQWFRNPQDPARQRFPWEVYNIVNLNEAAPTAIAAGDLNSDGVMDVFVAFAHRIHWLRPEEGDVSGVWAAFELYEDDDTTTAIRDLRVVDLDGDGHTDVVAPLDRAGNKDDRIMWLRNLGQ